MINDLKTTFITIPMWQYNVLMKERFIMELFITILSLVVYAVAIGLFLWYFFKSIKSIRASIDKVDLSINEHLTIIESKLVSKNQDNE